MAWVATEAFTYADSALAGNNGGSGWNGAWANYVEGAAITIVSNRVSGDLTSAGGDQTGRNLTTAVVDGILKVTLRRNTSKTTGKMWFVIKTGLLNSDLPFAAIQLTTTNIVLTGGSTVTLVTDYALGTDYIIHIKFDTAGSGTIWARLDGDSAWSNSIAGYGIDTAGATVKSVIFRQDASGTGTFIADDIGAGSEPVAAIDISVFESVTVTESITVEIALGDISVNDTVTITESVTIENATLGDININDTIVITESVTVENTTLGDVSVNDAITVAEAITIENIELGGIDIFDAISISESVTVDFPIELSIFDTISVTESVTVDNTELGGANVNEAISVTEVVTIENTELGGIDINDIITISESIAIDLVLDLSIFDTISVTESVTVENTELSGIDVNESVSITEVITIENAELGGIETSDTITISESIAIDLVLDLSIFDTLSISESVTTETNLGNIDISDSIAITESTSLFVTPAPTNLMYMRFEQQLRPIPLNSEQQLRPIPLNSEEQIYPKSMDDDAIS